MASAGRMLARGNSSWTAGMTAYEWKVSGADVDGRELFPGIPNHVTMGNIFSKLDWKTCNVLQMVNREWRQTIYNRSLYDARVLSKSTKAFLVMVTYGNEEPVRELVLTLYSCTDNSFLRLPPIPAILLVRVDRECIDFICLEGRVYLWIRPRRAEWVQLYVLDLAGHMKWAQRKPVNSSDWCNGLGVLDGKIYRFLGSSYFVLTHDDPFPGRESSIQEKVERLPYTEIYDPVQDAWSLITPTPPAGASIVDLERHLASFSDWAEKKLATDPSKSFLTNGRYESYFSEWKQKHSTTSTVDDDSGNAMATQVYYSNACMLSTFKFRKEEVFSFGGKLVKYETLLRCNTQAELGIEKYDARTIKWERWKSVRANFQPLKKGCTFSIDVFDEFAAAGNSLWAIVGVYAVTDGWPFFTYFLVRSPELVGVDNVKSVLWIDTGFQVGRSTCSPLGSILRPIYL